MTRSKTTKGEQKDDFDLPPKKLPKLFEEGESPWNNAWDEIIKQSRDFLAELHKPDILSNLLAPKSGYIELPIPEYIGLPFRLINVQENEKLPVLQRGIFQTLQNFVSTNKGLTYVHGPQGFGKSFALYHLFCYLSADYNNRVLYIPNCDMLNDNVFRKLFQAVLAAFSRDGDFIAKMAPFATQLDGAGWSDLLDVINQHCEENNLKFYAIFDQHNALHAEKRRLSPTNLIVWPESLNGPFFKIIICASANNSDHELMSDPEAKFPFLDGLSHKELKAWQTKHAFFPNDSLELLTDLTGNIPMELYRVLVEWKEPSAVGRTLPQVLNSYRVLRLGELNTGHKKYLEASGANRPALEYSSVEHKCMVYMANDLPLPLADKLVFDRKLFYSTSTRHIRPAIPLAREVAWYHMRPMDPEVFTKEVFSSNLPNDAKVRMAEYYIIQRLIKAQHISLPLRTIGHDEKLRDLKKGFSSNVELFNGILPGALPVQNTLFVPTSPKYTDVDFLLYLPKRSHLYSFQVTVLASPWTHENKWKKGNPIYDQWKTFCSPVFNTKVWIVSTPMGSAILPKTPNGKKKKLLREYPKHRWVPFSDPDVCTHFPKLKYFNKVDDQEDEENEQDEASEEQVAADDEY